ncbi:MAG: DUF2975 domain-containing protein [Clostridia bacterium]|nr:DUF2975 domain-containing protein [Clostridia bacterium]
MDQKKLAIWLKAIVVGCALCGLALFGFILPRYLAYAAEEVPDLPYTAWSVFMWVLAVPCYAVLVCIWKMSDEIKRDNSFSLENAKLLKYIALLAGLDSALLLVGNLCFMLTRHSVPTLALASAILCFVGLAMSVGAACLSHLVHKAAVAQEEGD